MTEVLHSALAASLLPRVIIESPYAGDVELNLAYARECLLDSINRAEAPIASHLLYTQVLNDDDPRERQQGIVAGLAWLHTANLSVANIDLGWSTGMKIGQEVARQAGVRCELRRLPLYLEWRARFDGARAALIDNAIAAAAEEK